MSAVIDTARDGPAANLLSVMTVEHVLVPDKNLIAGRADFHRHPWRHVYEKDPVPDFRKTVKQMDGLARAG